jgi:hypothetical protein
MSLAAGIFRTILQWTAQRIIGTRFAAFIGGETFMERLIRIVVLAIILGALTIVGRLLPALAFE